MSLVSYTQDTRLVLLPHPAPSVDIVMKPDWVAVFFIPRGFRYIDSYDDSDTPYREYSADDHCLLVLNDQGKASLHRMLYNDPCNLCDIEESWLNMDLEIGNAYREAKALFASFETLLTRCYTSYNPSVRKEIVPRLITLVAAQRKGGAV